MPSCEDAHLRNVRAGTSTFTGIFKNSVALSLSISLERGVAFFLSWYIARTLGKGAIGEYGLVMAFIAVFGTVACLGLDQLVPREVARNRSLAGLYLVSAGSLGGLASVLFAVVLVLITDLLGYPDHIRCLLYIVAAFVLLFDVEASIGEATIKGLERMEWIVAVLFPAGIVRVGLSIFALSLGSGLGSVLLVLAAYQALVCVIYLLLLVRIVPRSRLRLDRRLCWSLFRKTMVFMAISVLSMGFKQIDRVILSKMADTEAVGLYVTGAVLVQMVDMMAPALMEALYPKLSQAFFTSPYMFAQLTERSFKLVLIGIFPIALSISALAPIVVLRIFGAAYAQSVIVLRILAWALVPAFVGRLLYRVILASNNERVTMRVASMNSIASVLLNFLLIPLWGIIGTSVAAVLTELLGFLQNLWFVSNKVLSMNIRDTVLKPIFCAMGSGVVYWRLLEKGPCIALPAALTVFAVALLISGTVSSQELTWLRLVWKNIKMRYRI